MTALAPVSVSPRPRHPATSVPHWRQRSYEPETAPSRRTRSRRRSRGSPRIDHCDRVDAFADAGERQTPVADAQRSADTMSGLGIGDGRAYGPLGGRSRFPCATDMRDPLASADAIGVGCSGVPERQRLRLERAQRWCSPAALGAADSFMRWRRSTWSTVRPADRASLDHAS
jgi:hypothetical protein